MRTIFQMAEYENADKLTLLYVHLLLLFWMGTMSYAGVLNFPRRRR